MNIQKPDPFTIVEWWIFRLTGIALLSLVAYKLIRGEFTGLF